MKIQIIRLSLVFGIAFFLASCDFLKEEETQEQQSEQYTNTLNQSLGGAEGAITDYFYKIAFASSSS